jgi:hypothetical protein
MEREGVQYAVSLFTRSEGPNRNILNAHGRSCEENPPKLSPGENQNKRVFGQAGPTRTRRHEILRPLPHPTARVHPVPWAGSTRAPRRVGTRAAAGPAREHVGDGETRGRNLLSRWVAGASFRLRLCSCWGAGLPQEFRHVFYACFFGHMELDLL